jgi:hypothetical protein
MHPNTLGADVRIRTCRHDGLSLLYLNGRSGIAIWFHHHEEQQEWYYDHCVCDNWHDRRNRRPTETMVERGKHNEPYKPKDEKRRDEFLTRSLLRCGSDVHAALNELSVVHKKIDAQRLRGHLKHGYEDPRLPIVERACRNEQAREQNCERYQVG